MVVALLLIERLAVPDELDPALEQELWGRIAEMKSAHERGVPAGAKLSFDEMMAIVRS